MKKNKMFQNASMLLIMNIAKMIFPLITLPYLTRVLSTETYGVVAYVRSVMIYMQVFVDFGFALSATKDIVEANGNKEKIGRITGNVLFGNLLLSAVGTVLLVPIIAFIPVLKGYGLYVLLSQVSVILSCFFIEYFFNGMEQMHLLTIRFVVMKTISTALTFIIVKGEADMLWIPVLDIIGYGVAAVFSMVQLKKYQIPLKTDGIVHAWKSIKKSFYYFLSNMASTAFNVLNTLLIGIYASATDVAYWSVCLQLISAVQAVYSPIANGIYPEMIRSKKIGIVLKICKVFMPLITAGCIFTVVVAKYALAIVGGPEYMAAAPVLIRLTPVLFFSFGSFMLGWPAMGAIHKVKEITYTTLMSAGFQIVSLIVLAAIGQFEIIYIAIIRSITEAILAISRIVYCLKYKKEFR